MVKKLNQKQIKIIGKVANITQDKRLAYLEGMIDYIQTTNSRSEREFITALYNYVAEHGSGTQTILVDFCDHWKKENNNA